MRITSAAAGVVVLFSIGSMFFSQQASFAQTIEAIKKATSITWKHTGYTRFFSEDGKRSWLKAHPPMEMAYQAPNLYRDTRYDEESNIRTVEIVDTSTNKVLHLNMKTKIATWLNSPTNYYGPDGPFGVWKELLTNKPIELVGQKQLNGAKVNVFRFHRDTKGIPDHMRTYDIWLDAKTKKLVRQYDPGADSFDPETDADRNKPAEEQWSKGELMGSMISDIVFDADLAPELFSMTPPEGFEVVVQPPKPTITEAQMIEWLGATARFNDSIFSDTPRGIGLERYNEATSKDEAERTEVEHKLITIQHKHTINRNGVVMASFANEYTVDGRFRYLGKGVKLGDAERIVLYYKLKSSGVYRAVYGNLTVKDVDPEDLPLPVEENLHN